MRLLIFHHQSLTGLNAAMVFHTMCHSVQLERLEIYKTCLPSYYLLFITHGVMAWSCSRLHSPQQVCVLNTEP